MRQRRQQAPCDAVMRSGLHVSLAFSPRSASTENSACRPEVPHANSQSPLVVSGLSHSSSSEICVDRHVALVILRQSPLPQRNFFCCSCEVDLQHLNRGNNLLVSKGGLTFGAGYKRAHCWTSYVSSCEHGRSIQCRWVQL